MDVRCGSAHPRGSILATIVALALGSCAPAPPADEPEELPTVDLTGGGAFPLDAHLESADIAAGEHDFEELFEAGGDLFHTAFNGHDGVGAMRLPDGSPHLRFHPVPPGGGALATLSSQSCGGCHIGAASGLAQSNVAGDPGMDGEPPFNVRSTTSLFGNGLLQLLAQEITEDLHAIRDRAAEAALADPGSSVERELVSKGVAYGTIVSTADGEGNVGFDLSGLEGVDPDLVVRPLGWKGHMVTVRANTMGAAAVLMGLQAEELVWRLPFEGDPIPDADADGVERELSVGDVTAMVVYGAAQETPQSVGRLVDLGLVAPPSAEDSERIEAGRRAFEATGCAGCHLPEMRLENTVFEEPTRRGNGQYYDLFLAGKDESYDLERPFRFDLLTEAEEPRVEAHPDGGAVVRLYGDLKRHHMGRQLADPGGPTPALTPMLAPLTLDEEMVLIPATAFLTPELWGVGNTGPWLHDGRAGTLDEAIRWHGEDDPPAIGDPGRSEAQESRDAYVALSVEERDALLTFLRSLHTYESRDD